MCSIRQLWSHIVNSLIEILIQSLILLEEEVNVHPSILWRPSRLQEFKVFLFNPYRCIFWVRYWAKLNWDCPPIFTVLGTWNLVACMRWRNTRPVGLLRGCYSMIFLEDWSSFRFCLLIARALSCACIISSCWQSAVCSFGRLCGVLLFEWKSLLTTWNRLCHILNVFLHILTSWNFAKVVICNYSLELILVLLIPESLRTHTLILICR